MKIRQICTMLVAIVSSASFMLEHSVSARTSLQERTFEVTYASEVNDLPPSAKQV
jgi:hypothetical protein